MPGKDVDMIIIQVSRPQDRMEAETALAAQGLLPITLFADGPEKAFLIGAKPDDLKSAFASSTVLAAGYGADRLAMRMRVFNGISDAIRTEFKYLADPADFPNDVALLFVEALVQVGLSEPDDITPCAVRFLRANLDMPDFEEAPDDDVDLRTLTSAPSGEA
jgi:hypothetical protein